MGSAPPGRESRWLQANDLPRAERRAGHFSITGRYEQSGSLFGFTFRRGEDDLVHKEEHHHGDTPVQNGSADVVDEIRHQQTGHSHPDAVDGVHDAGDDAEGHQIPGNLRAQLAVRTEHEVALDGEVDALADHHGNHVGAEVGKAAVRLVVAQDVPLKGFAKQGQRNAGPAEAGITQTRKRRGQELQHQVLEHGDQIAYDHEQAALANPLGSRRMLGGKIIPEIHFIVGKVFFAPGCRARLCS